MRSMRPPGQSARVSHACQSMLFAVTVFTLSVSAPDGALVNRAERSLRSLKNAIFEPSGAHTGEISLPVEEVTRSVAEPSLPTVYTSMFVSDTCLSKASRSPSGAQEGSVSSASPPVTAVGVPSDTSSTLMSIERAPGAANASTPSTGDQAGRRPPSVPGISSRFVPSESIT